jgi:wyosine [tRNA(Phe)-imidazoG37] synthetase (radical SAM superfamily)
LDLVPPKTCVYDCIYCQIGRTTAQQLERREFVPVGEMLSEVRAALAAGANPDYVTLSGSGEPTLYARLGDLIAGLRPLGVPVAVLTSGALLWREDVASEVAAADLVCPSLDAGTEATWRRVNRPPAELSFEKMLEGLVGFREKFAGQLWLEVLLVAGVSDSEEEIRTIAAHAARIRPERIQLNTVARPPAESSALPVPRERLEALAARFDPPAEVIADFSHASDGGRSTAGLEDVLEMLRRRPCTVEDVASGLDISLDEAAGHVKELCFQRRVAARDRDGRCYYEAAAES